MDKKIIRRKLLKQLHCLLQLTKFSGRIAKIEKETKDAQNQIKKLQNLPDDVEEIKKNLAAFNQASTLTQIVTLVTASFEFIQKANLPMLIALSEQMQQQKAVQKLMTIVRWDPSSCDGSVILVFPTVTRIKQIGEKQIYGIARVSFVFPPQNSEKVLYFEAKIIQLQREYGILHSDIGIGFVTKNTPLCHQMPGKFPGTFAYFNDGFFYGQLPGENVSKVSFNSDAKFRVGDVVGCGIDLASKEIIFTKNGVRFMTKFNYVHSTDDLYPGGVLVQSWRQN